MGNPLEANGSVCVRIRIQLVRLTSAGATLGAWRVVRAGNHIRGATKVDDPLTQSGGRARTVIRCRSHMILLTLRTDLTCCSPCHESGVGGVRDVDLQQVLIEPCKFRPLDFCVEAADSKVGFAVTSVRIERVTACGGLVLEVQKA